VPRYEEDCRRLRSHVQNERRSELCAHVRSEAEAKDYYHFLRDQLFHDLNDWQHQIDSAADKAIERH
jgi:hypothetical protein